MKILLILIIFIACCATPSETKTPPPPEKTTLKKAPPVDSERVFFSNISGKKVSAKELSNGKPVVFHITASWCEPCKELAKRLNELREHYYVGKIEFFSVYKKGDSPLAEDVVFPCYYFENSFPELSLEDMDIFPRLLVFNEDGALTALIDGLYPTLYYYAVFEEIAGDK